MRRCSWSCDARKSNGLTPRKSPRAPRRSMPSTPAVMVNRRALPKRSSVNRMTDIAAAERSKAMLRRLPVNVTTRIRDTTPTRLQQCPCVSTRLSRHMTRSRTTERLTNARAATPARSTPPRATQPSPTRPRWSLLLSGPRAWRTALTCVTLCFETPLARYNNSLRRNDARNRQRMPAKGCAAPTAHATALPIVLCGRTKSWSWSRSSGVVRGAAP
mmetsp:Transcript_47499/g.146551  ORF Transcript_47499/g.146551 Transcript_47499/m.146551 type:complete len:216 (+) Transcript_47499:80-727(+)